jgi:phage baseplate assembly protein W
MPVNILTGNSKKITVFQDFKKDLEISPISLDLTVNKNEDAVKESIYNLILTNRGERLMQPDIGGNISAMLFENMTPATFKLIEEQVRTTIDLYEPRATLIDVNVTGNLDANNIRVEIIFFVSNNEQPVTLSVFLERTR